MSGRIEQINIFPEDWAKVKSDTTIATTAATAATATIRLQTPIAHMRRTATCDTFLGGEQMKKNDKIVLWYNSSNRDETIFPNADHWNVTRENSRRRQSFGYGIHRCLGARLAELQIANLIEEMAKRNMEVKHAAPPTRIPSCFTNGFHHMMVTKTRS